MIAARAQSASKTVANELTLVEVSRAKKARQSLIFGKPQRLIKRGKGSRLAVFETGQIIGYERWISNGYGTTSRLFFVVLCGPLETFNKPINKVPGIYPGAAILFNARGSVAVKRVLSWIITVQKRPDMTVHMLTERHWRRLNQLRKLRHKYPDPSQFWEGCRHD